MKQTLRQSFAACEHHAQYLATYGTYRDAAFDKWLHGNFSRWLEAEYPALQGGAAPVLSETDCIDLLDQYRELWELRDIARAEYPELAVRILAEGERHEAWQLPVVEGLLTRDYWAKLWDLPKPKGAAHSPGCSYLQDGVLAHCDCPRRSGRLHLVT